MTKETALSRKVKIANEISICVSKIKYYQDAIGKLSKSEKSFREGSIDVKILNTKTIWLELSAPECLHFLQLKLSQEKKKLNQLL